MQRDERTDDRAPGMRRRGLLAALLTFALAVIVLRAPLDVLALFAPTETPFTEPASDRLGNVAPDLAQPTAGTMGTGTAAGTEVPDHPDGRWGEPAPRPTSELVLEEMRGGWRIEGGVEEAAALAVIAAHEWAQSKGLSGSARGTTRGTIVVIEAVERPGPHHAVVTLLVSTGTEHHRIAVPTSLGTEGATVAGAPWTLPMPPLRNEPLQGTAIGDPELLTAARHALRHVGIDGDRLRALEATDGWPFIARLEDDTDGHPWLRWHVDRFVVTGLPLNAVRDG